MEKKLNRSVQTPKGIVEAKKSQDVPVGKPFSKSSRKRDNSAPKFDPSRKQPNGPVQKNKYHNRRSSARGYHHESGGKNTELVSELDEDFDLKKSKKRNLTYLLNFHCKPRDGALNASHYSAPKSIIHNTIRDLMTTQKHKYNKEQFLQANCQFVVRADEDYSVYMGDPDILVDWKFIEQIRVLAPELVNCPICLCYPTAAKITRCGHIYCWPCVLHYLALTDKPWHKCPICFEAVHRKDLKSVKLLNQIQYNTGNEITFQLVKRERGSTITMPVSEGTSRSSNTLLYVTENQRTTVYSKLLLADHKNILKIIEDEENELRCELSASENTPELCFVEEAVQLLSERRAKLLQDKVGPSEDIPCCSSSLEDKIDIPSNLSSSPESITEEFPFESITNILDDDETAKESIVGSPPRTKIRYESVSSNGEDTIPNVTAEDLEISANANIPHAKDFYFYQAIDGQQIFLHSINARMLEREYGSLENGPPVITGSIVEIESGSMTEGLRKRLRYLQHLPLTCQFLVIEVDLPPEIVSPETKNYFKDQLDKRNREREKRAKEERKIQKKAEQLANKQLGRHSPPRSLRLDSYHHFPECGSDTPPNLSPRIQSATSSRASSPHSNMSRRSTSPLNKVLSSLTLNNNNTFAQKLKDTNKDGGWRKRATVSESEASTSHSRNLISDAVEAALIKAQQEKEANKQNSGKNKKKKKQKPVPLCSVGMVYTNQ